MASQDVERDAIVSAADEGPKRLDDAVHKLHELFQGWEDFCAFQWTYRKGQAYLRWQVRVANNGEVWRSVSIPSAEDGACDGHKGWDQHLVLVLDVEIMDRAKSGIALSVGLEFEQ